MKLYFETSRERKEILYPEYSKHVKQLLRHLVTDTIISRFDAFNKRFKISWGMQFEFADDLNIKSETVRDCYRLMLKIADLWFAFEHLVEVASPTIPRNPNKSKVDFYDEATLEAIAFPIATAHFNLLLREHVVRETSWRREIYHLIAYLKNNTTGGTKTTISELRDLVHERLDFEAKHIFALAYGIRNIYVHQGVSAALGTENYQVKKALYCVLHDTLILYSLTLGHAYCQRKLLDYEPGISD